MTHLFMRLYLDEDVDILVADLIRARGFTVMTTRDAGNLGVNDRDQLHYAATHNYTFFTHNRADFEALAQHYTATKQTHAGIILAVRHTPYEITRRVLLILNYSTADEMENQLRYI